MNGITSAPSYNPVQKRLVNMCRLQLTSSDGSLNTEETPLCSEEEAIPEQPLKGQRHRGGWSRWMTSVCL